jgi:hypothetical protein
MDFYVLGLQKRGKRKVQYIVIPSKSHSAAVFILLEGNLPKPGNSYCGLTDQRPTNKLTTDELKYSHNRAQRHQCLTNNLLEVRQNSAISGSRPIGATVEALLPIVVNWQLS